MKTYNWYYFQNYCQNSTQKAKFKLNQTFFKRT